MIQELMTQDIMHHKKTDKSLYGFCHGWCPVNYDLLPDLFWSLSTLWLDNKKDISQDERPIARNGSYHVNRDHCQVIIVDCDNELAVILDDTGDKIRKQILEKWKNKINFILNTSF